MFIYKYIYRERDCATLKSAFVALQFVLCLKYLYWGGLMYVGFIIPQTWSWIDPIYCTPWLASSLDITR